MKASNCIKAQLGWEGSPGGPRKHQEGLGGVGVLPPSMMTPPQSSACPAGHSHVAPAGMSYKPKGLWDRPRPVPRELPGDLHAGQEVRSKGPLHSTLGPWQVVDGGGGGPAGSSAGGIWPCLEMVLIVMS